MMARASTVEVLTAAHAPSSKVAQRIVMLAARKSRLAVELSTVQLFNLEVLVYVALGLPLEPNKIAGRLCLVV
jgi:hypothetical protein